MNIQFNGQPHITNASNLADLLTELGYELNSKVATAVNGLFVAKTCRNEHVLNEGDQIEVVAPMQGG